MSNTQKPRDKRPGRTILTPFIHPTFLANDRLSIDQKKNFNTSSTVRAVLTVLVIVPNVFGALMSRAGGPKLGCSSG